MCFVLWLINAAVFGTYLNVGLLQVCCCLLLLTVLPHPQPRTLQELTSPSCHPSRPSYAHHQGPEAAREFLTGLVLGTGSDPWLGGAAAATLAQQAPPEQVAHALGAVFMAPGPAELVLTLWALAVVAPRVESVLG